METKEKKIKVTKEMLAGSPDKQAEFNSMIGEILNPSSELKKLLAKTEVSREELRFLVDTFYQIQELRISIEAQIRSIVQESDDSVSHELLSWLYNQIYVLERGINVALDAATKASNVGLWLQATMGIGPTLAAALIAYFDITKAKSAGQFWSYAGLNDNNRPKIGSDKAKSIVEKAIASNNGKLDESVVMDVCKITGRDFNTVYTKATANSKKGDILKDDLIKAISFLPYNKNLKVICWKCGHQFALLQNNQKSLYGRMLKERKAWETAKNEAGEYADQARKILQSGNYNFDLPEGVDESKYDLYRDSDALIHHKKYGKTTDAYKALSEGKLPAAQIQARAERYATKLFISHLFEMMYKDHYKCDPPVFYTIAHQGHVHYIDPEVAYDSVK